MNIEKFTPSVAQEAAAEPLVAAETHSNAIRVLDAEEILHVAGGPEAVIGDGVNPP